jgi:hypothetical protein
MGCARLGLPGVAFLASTRNIVPVLVETNGITAVTRFFMPLGPSLAFLVNAILAQVRDTVPVLVVTERFSTNARLLVPVSFFGRNARLAKVRSPIPFLVIPNHVAALAVLLVPLGAPCPAFGLAILTQVRDTVPVLVVMKRIATIRTRSFVPLAHVDLFSKELTSGTTPAPAYISPQEIVSSVRN